MLQKSALCMVLLVTGVLWLAGCPVAADVTPNSTPLPSDTIPPYTGAIGPDSPLYGFKITLENLDESFTFNQSEKLDKEINHTELRLSELTAALAKNQTDAVNRTLDQYLQKYNQSEMTLDLIASSGNVPNTTFSNGSSLKPPQNGTGLERALQNLQLHQETFRNLMEEYPNNTGLAQAYNNSLGRELRFEEKIRERAGSGNTSRDTGRNVTETGTFVPPGHKDGDLQNQTRNAGMNGTFPGEINQSAGQQDRPGQVHSGSQSDQNNGQGQPTGHTGNDKGSPDDTKTVSPQKTTASVTSQGNGNAQDTEKTNNNGNTRQTNR